MSPAAIAAIAALLLAGWIAGVIMDRKERDRDEEHLPPGCGRPR